MFHNIAIYTRAHVQEDTRLSHRRVVSVAEMGPRANHAPMTSLIVAMVSASPLTDSVTASVTVTTWRTRTRARVTRTSSRVGMEAAFPGTTCATRDTTARTGPMKCLVHVRRTSSCVMEVSAFQPRRNVIKFWTAGI